MPRVKSWPELASVGCGIPSVVKESIELFALFSDAQATASVLIRDGRPGHAKQERRVVDTPEHHCYKLHAKATL